MKKIKIVVVGNCQARPIAELLKKLNSNIEVINIAIVHLLKSEQYSEYNDDFESADYIISQLVADNYPCEFVRSRSLKEKYGAKVVTIVNLFFLGYTPDLFYIRIPEKGTLKGPLGDYHNKTIVESWINGRSVQETAKLLKNIEYNTHKYSLVLSQSLVELESREEHSDVKICSYIAKEMFLQRLFFTFNHPTKTLLTAYTTRILKHIQIEINPGLTFDTEPLNQVIPILNCGTGFSFPLDEYYKGFDITVKESKIQQGKSREYDTEELISTYFKVYSANSKVVMNAKL